VSRQTDQGGPFGGGEDIRPSATSPVGGLSLIEAAANDPDLTLDQASLAMTRAVLLDLAGGSEPKVGQIAAMIDAMAKLRSAGGGEDLAAVLRAFSEGADAESTVA
jgi:hypothetical protein